MQDKVRSTLKQFVRDWSTEGKPEREACYSPCIAALEEHFGYLPVDERSVAVASNGLIRSGTLSRYWCLVQVWDDLRWISQPKVKMRSLYPRPAADTHRFCIARERVQRIHALCIPFRSQQVRVLPFAQTNSHTAYSSSEAEYHEIYPFLHSFSHHISTANSLLRSVRIPDVLPANVLGPDSDFSLVAGDFEEVYGQDENQHGQWGAVVTCFFIDTVSCFEHARANADGFRLGIF